MSREVWVVESCDDNGWSPAASLIDEEDLPESIMAHERVVRYVPTDSLDLGRADAWIPVGERLPAAEDPVLVHSPRAPKAFVAFLTGDGVWWPVPEVTHWQPLPAPPKVTP